MSEFPFKMIRLGDFCDISRISTIKTGKFWYPYLNDNRIITKISKQWNIPANTIYITQNGHLGISACKCFIPNCLTISLKNNQDHSINYRYLYKTLKDHQQYFRDMHEKYVLSKKYKFISTWMIDDLQIECPPIDVQKNELLMLETGTLLLLLFLFYILMFFFK